MLKVKKVRKSYEWFIRSVNYNWILIHRVYLDVKYKYVKVESLHYEEIN